MVNHLQLEAFTELQIARDNKTQCFLTSQEATALLTHIERLNGALERIERLSFKAVGGTDAKADAICVEIFNVAKGALEARGEQ